MEKKSLKRLVQPASAVIAHQSLFRTVLFGSDSLMPRSPSAVRALEARIIEPAGGNHRAGPIMRRGNVDQSLCGGQAHAAETLYPAREPALKAVRRFVLVFAAGVGAVVCAALMPSWAYASCGSAVCAVNTHWNLQGFAPEPGLRLDLRYEYIDQDQPIAGSDKVAVGQVHRHHDEIRTINRNYLGTLDYTLNHNWGVAVTIPFLDRSHSHIHNHHGAQLLEQWNFGRLGDARVLGRYQMSAEEGDKPAFSFYGVNFGLKLPTGERKVRNAEGDRAERTLQPGTGTTDALLGAFYSRLLPNSDASWFVQVLWQKPLGDKEDYKPGPRLSLDAGYRYEATDRIGLMIQLNALYQKRDRGQQAEPEDTGGKFLFVSPGVGFAIAKGTQIYGFIQLPLYQYVNGVQLTADWSVVAGISSRF